MTNTLVAVGRAWDQFMTSEMVDELGEIVGLTMHNGERLDEEAYAKALSETQAEIVMTGWSSPLLTVEVMKVNPQLKYLCNLTGAVRRMVTKEAIEAGLLVSNWGNLIGPTVAEAALLAMLSCLRRSVEVAFLMHQEKGWRSGNDQRVESLFYQTVGLHGFGNVAQHLVKMLAPFKCEISAYDPYLSDDVFENAGVRRILDLNALYSENRIISLHGPKTDETYHVVNAKLLQFMQDGAILVNTSRGALIDIDALISELKTGRISASLDVYEEEPLPSHSELRGLLNCQLTPHTGGPTTDRYVDFGRAAIENIRKYVNGEAVDHVVDVQTYGRIT